MFITELTATMPATTRALFFLLNFSYPLLGNTSFSSVSSFMNFSVSSHTMEGAEKNTETATKALHVYFSILRAVPKAALGFEKPLTTSTAIKLKPKVAIPMKATMPRLHTSAESIIFRRCPCIFSLLFFMQSLNGLSVSIR